VRSLWRGALSFGLIHIPVRLYSAVHTHELKFKMLHKKDLSEIRYARICKADGKEIPWSDIVKGYELEKGDYVILTEEDFEKASLKKSKTIEIFEFTHQDEIDTMYYDTPYYLEPEKGAEKAYALLRESLAQSNKVAVANFVFHHREHLGVIKPHESLLVFNTLRYQSEVVNPKELNIKALKLPKQEVDVALQLIEELTKPFVPKNYADTYVEEVKALIKRKSKGQKTHVKKAEAPSPKIHDIMSLLKESLQESKKKKKRKSA